MMSKVAVAGVSLILVVGVIVGVVSTVSRSGGAVDTSKSSEGGLSTGMKAVDTLCAPTHKKDLCQKVLTPIAQANSSVTPAELIRGIFEASLREVQKLFNETDKFSGETDPMEKMALNDCKDLFSFAVDELQSAMSTVGDRELYTIHDKIDDINNWLSAVITYQFQCLDGLEKPEIKSVISDGVVNATDMTANVLGMVESVAKLLNKVQIPDNLKSNPASRRLLDTEVDKDGYPTWFSAADRKLLANGGRKGKGGGGGGGGGVRVPPNAVVAKDGSGQFKSINDAINSYPKGHKGRYVIYVKAGKYDEYIIITQEKKNIYMYGDGSRTTIVTGKKSVKGGTKTMQSATFSVVADGFICQGMGFSNTAGAEGEQAVALRVQADMVAFFSCRMDGYQDTLYVQAHRQLYRNCVISGTVDFIFGGGRVVIQNSRIIVRKGMHGQKNMVTAHQRTHEDMSTGIVIHNCRIVPDQSLFPVRLQTKTFLGRPWRPLARVVVMESELGDLIDPAGWSVWDANSPTDQSYYAEYANRGPGAKTDLRVKWKGYKGVISRREALQFTVGPFINEGNWLATSGVKYTTGLVR